MDKKSVAAEIAKRLREISSKFPGEVLENQGQRIPEPGEPSFESLSHLLSMGSMITSQNWNALISELCTDLSTLEHILKMVEQRIEQTKYKVIQRWHSVPDLLVEIDANNRASDIVKSKLEGCSKVHIYTFGPTISKDILPGNKEVGGAYIDWCTGERLTAMDVCQLTSSHSGRNIMVLPQSESITSPVSRIRHTWKEESTRGNGKISDIGRIENVCDKDVGSFWISRISSNRPLVVPGPVDVTVLSSGRGNPKANEYPFTTPLTKEANNLKGNWKLGLPRQLIVKIIEGGTISSGNVKFVTYHRGYIDQPLRCTRDLGISCGLKQTNYYTRKCKNVSCPLHLPRNLRTIENSNTWYPVITGYGEHSGYYIRFNNGQLSDSTYLPPGMTWLINTNIQSVGAVITLECEIPTPGMHDYIDISPTSTSFIIEEMSLSTTPHETGIDDIVVARNERVSQLSRFWINTQDDYRFLRLKLRQDKYNIATYSQEKDTVNIITDSILASPSTDVAVDSVNKRLDGTLVSDHIKIPSSNTVDTSYVYSFGLREITVGKLKYHRRGMRILAPIECDPVGEIWLSHSSSSPANIISSETYNHNSGCSIEFGARLAVMNRNGKVFRSIDIPIPRASWFNVYTDPTDKSIMYEGIAGERLNVRDGQAILRFPIVTPKYMIVLVEEELPDGTIRKYEQVHSGNIVVYDLNQRRFLRYGTDIDITVSDKDNIPVTTIHILKKALESHILSASYVPTSGVTILHNSGIQLDGYKVLVESIPGCDKVKVYPTVIMRGNPLNNSITPMLKELTVYISEYEK